LGQGVHSRRWRGFGVGGVLLMHLLFFIGVTEDDDVVITEWPKRTTVEIAEQLLGNFLVP
jgi:hypothetical protein